MSYTLAEAAAACGINRSTVLRALKSGRISGTRDEAGTWHVEPVELHRHFAPRAAPEAVPQLAQPNAQADAMVALLREQIADLRSDRDHWREAHERGQAALAEALAAHTATQRLLPAPDAAPVEQDAPPIEHSTAAVEQGLRAVEQALRPIEQEARAVEQETMPIEEEATAVDLPRWPTRIRDMLASLGGAPARIRA
jgi:uncharacterized membrane protein YccC